MFWLDIKMKNKKNVTKFQNPIMKKIKNRCTIYTPNIHTFSFLTWYRHYNVAAFG